MADTFTVRAGVNEAAGRVRDYVVDGSVSGEVLDDYTDAAGTRVVVFEKYYYRAGNRLTLTVIYTPRGDNLTDVHYVSGGGGNGALFNFDWGASGSFENAVPDALGKYR